MEFPILPRLPGGLKDIIFGAMSVVHHSKLTADWRLRVRARNLVERFFNKIKHCRRVATRCARRNAGRSHMRAKQRQVGLAEPVLAASRSGAKAGCALGMIVSSGAPTRII
ncbi:hypothetical protein AC244_29995 [Ensifer adhaerens]|uniref:Transposase DDE domain-containing protein n=1 Tax=Ensifer adhaerens TaxID=106592 RepID=A0A0L8BGR3_ENSAD|nr:hypothetical protein [Ensifer adhaerens]KOF13735.1 hypothetical protein AC244_29995 [Ensifer adhaerens]